MSTRTAIFKEQENGTFKGIYCHHDGYLEGVGYTLLKHYQDPEKVKALLELGDILSLGEFLAPKKGQTHTLLDPTPNTSVAYHRDRGDNYDDVKPKEFTGNKPALKWRFQEYNYFFGLDKKWYLVIVHPGIEKLWMIELYNYLV